LSTSSAIFFTDRFGTLRITSAGPVSGATVRVVDGGLVALVPFEVALSVGVGVVVVVVTRDEEREVEEDPGTGGLPCANVDVKKNARSVVRARKNDFAENIVSGQMNGSSW
jgi:NAD/NADP transhydrogenase alpha subunit